MRESSRILPFLLVSLLFGCIVFPLGLVQDVQAESSAVEDALAAEGLTLVALRNDTMDMNQDGEPDAIRLVVILNSSSDWTEIELRLYGIHKDKEVLQEQYMAFTGQSN
ncbi:MAG: hypothetical protein ACKVHC_04960, partial [Candidatus Poseidoniales archaeon]